jgi:hypothetical protein
MITELKFHFCSFRILPTHGSNASLGSGVEVMLLDPGNTSQGKYCDYLILFVSFVSSLRLRAQ